MGAITAKLKVEGLITARCYNQAALRWYEKLWNRIVRNIGLSKDKERSLTVFGPLKWTDEKKNVICNPGLQAIGEVLAGTYGGAGDIDYCALGSNAGAVASTDTTLGTEVYRNVTASGTAQNNITYITAYYNETETSGTYEEFGNFIDGAAGADTGELWTHVLTGGWVKGLTDALVIDCKYTFTSS